MNYQSPHPLAMTAEDLEHADAEALIQIKAGKGVPHAEVAAWLASWGTDDEYPAQAEWFE